ncbi:MAG: hypothetical protein ING71_16670 [Rhodocyclaceae bacterium]|nr:hypothetical protein [Rhodocyclaceae bacterium]
MDIRVGDVVRLKPVKVSSVYYDGSFDFEGANESREGLGVIPSVFVEEFILRIETEAEKIARLEARVKELEAQQKTLAGEPEYRLVIETSNNPNHSNQIWTEVEPIGVKPWYPEQLVGYGPWIEGPPPKEMIGFFEVLLPYQRSEKKFFPVNPRYQREGIKYDFSVAHCLKLP